MLQHLILTDRTHLHRSLFFHTGAMNSETFEQIERFDQVVETARPTSEHENRADGQAVNNLLWPSDKNQLNVGFLNGDRHQRAFVKKTVEEHYHAVPFRIRFKFLKDDDPDPSDIRINFSNESFSYIGRHAEKYPGLRTMSLDVFSSISNQRERSLQRRAAILHEFGHALGMEHEHTHPDFKVVWNYRTLQATLGWDAERVNRKYNPSYYRQKGWDMIRYPYDPESIMHYEIKKGHTADKDFCRPEIYVLSSGDKNFLTAIYPQENTPNPTRQLIPAEEQVTDPNTRQPGVEPETNGTTLLSWLDPAKFSGKEPTVMKGGDVVIDGNDPVFVHGEGHVTSNGSGLAIVFGDSSIWLNGSGHVLVYGNGFAVVNGSGRVGFTGQAFGRVTGSGSYQQYVGGVPPKSYFAGALPSDR